jgi:molybdopterin molybdotransferase
MDHELQDSGLAKRVTITLVPTVTFREGRQCVLDRVRTGLIPPAVETVPLREAAGRVLAAEIPADRDYPPTDRSIRDGFAVCSVSLPGRLEVVGEVRAGETFAGTVRPGQAVEIFTGAPVPEGADQVVMVEHVRRDGQHIETERAAATGEFINRRGTEAREGQPVLRPGMRLDFAGVAQAAAVGAAALPVYRKPSVAILATGDEIVAVEESPRANQVRNSNSESLAAQVARAGGVPTVLPVAKDNAGDTRRQIKAGLGHDLLLLSGGVSAGKYDLVESVLADLGCEFYFDRALIQPGQPVVFGRAQRTFFFGLPGNPASTIVTFEIFARLALALLGGESNPSMPIASARLTKDFSHKTGLTRFLPARWEDGTVTPIDWQGSSDVPALAAANAFLVADSRQAAWREGDWIGVWPK